MARIALEEDEELSKLGLLRVSVVAKLLKVAPKTVHAWKDLTITKVHGVKYLTWKEVLEKKADVKLKSLAVGSADAYRLWKKPKEVFYSVPTTEKKIAVQNKAAELLAKVAKLLPANAPSMLAFNTEPMLEPEADMILDLPHHADEESVLDLPTKDKNGV